MNMLNLYQYHQINSRELERRAEQQRLIRTVKNSDNALRQARKHIGQSLMSIGRQIADV